MFLGVVFTPLIQSTVIEESNIPLTNGKTLYVGGSGPGNYTTIQDALDNAIRGDTVFVYDDSSPYYEHVTIHTKINLIGDDKNTTIIDGNNSGNVVTLDGNEINLNGFTIQRGDSWGTFRAAVKITSDYNIVSNNNIVNSGQGIIANDASNNIISNNIISNCGNGIMILEESGDNLITQNNIVNNKEGIILGNSGGRNPSNNIVSWNNIKDTQIDGIVTESQNKLVIVHNNIENGETGIFLMTSQFAKVKYNNFINLETNATFALCYGVRWLRNYWGRPMFLPKKIHGYNLIPTKGFIDWYHFDFRPAKIPYDITDFYLVRGAYDAD